MSVDYKKLELKLRKIVERRLEEGWALMAGSYFMYGPSMSVCCALGAIVAGELEPLTNANINEEVARRLGISDDTRASIVRGFDGVSIEPHAWQEFKPDPKAYAIGTRLRHDYLVFEDAS